MSLLSVTYVHRDAMLILTLHGTPARVVRLDFCRSLVCILCSLDVALNLFAIWQLSIAENLNCLPAAIMTEQCTAEAQASAVASAYLPH